MNAFDGRGGCEYRRAGDGDRVVDAGSGKAYGKRHERYLLPMEAQLGCHAIDMSYLSCFVEFTGPRNAHEFFLNIYSQRAANC